MNEALHTHSQTFVKTQLKHTIQNNTALYIVLDYCCMKWTNQIASLEVTIRDSYLARGNY